MAGPLDPRLRLGAVFERLRESTAAALGVGLLVGLVVGLVLGRLEGPAIVRATLDRQFTIMTTLLSAIMTVVGVVLSVMVVAQQLASQQYSPRAIRTSLRDRPTRLSLAALFGYVGFMVAVIASIGPDLRAPLGVPVGMVLSVLALGVVAYLIQHLTDGFRASRLVERIAADTLGAVGRIAAHDDDAGQQAARSHGLEDVPDGAVQLQAPVSGYLQDVAVDALARWLADASAVVRLGLPLGGFAGKGTPIGWAWHADGSARPVDPDRVQAQVDGHLRFGSTRTTQREIGSGVQQLVDVALRALSPGINDPYTAVQAVNMLTRVLQALAERRQDWLVGVVEGDLVLTVPRPLLWDMVDSATDQIRGVAGPYPQVLEALAVLLRTVACTRPAEADRIEAHLTALVAQAERAELLDRDLAAVRRRVEGIRQAVGTEGHPPDR